MVDDGVVDYVDYGGCISCSGIVIRVYGYSAVDVGYCCDAIPCEFSFDLVASHWHRRVCRLLPSRMGVWILL
jgi:hypothetical protein